MALILPLSLTSRPQWASPPTSLARTLLYLTGIICMFELTKSSQVREVVDSQKKLGLSKGKQIWCTLQLTCRMYRVRSWCKQESSPKNSCKVSPERGQRASV